MTNLQRIEATFKFLMQLNVVAGILAVWIGDFDTAFYNFGVASIIYISRVSEKKTNE